VISDTFRNSIKSKIYPKRRKRLASKATHDFSLGKTEGREFLGDNNPHQLGGLGSPSGFPTAQGFPLFPALRMASRDTVILLIVDNHAAIGARPPWPPCIRPWLALKLWLTLRLVFCLRKRNLLESISSERSRYVTSRSLWMQPMPFAKKHCLIYIRPKILYPVSQKNRILDTCP